jgi:transglutaminase-like putative cysteine protease
MLPPLASSSPLPETETAPTAGERGPGAEPPAGTWIDYDPTNDCLLGEQHITTAVGRDYGDVTPVRGVFYGGGEHQLSVAVDVDRLEPRL